MAKPVSLRIVNFVCTAEFFTHLNLPLVAELTGGKYGRKVFPAVVIRSMKPHVTLMLMGSGSVVVSGAASPDDAVYAAWLAAYVLQRDVPSMVPGIGACNVHVENIVATADVGYELDVKRLYEDNMGKSIYQPKKIKPVRYYPHLPDRQKPVIVAYDTGKIIITGATTQAEIHSTYDLLPWAKYRKKKDVSALADNVKKLSLK
jgi:TATA-box binding protein (TBP) (component of TFIID and TFIIIB)